MKRTCKECGQELNNAAETRRQQKEIMKACGTVNVYLHGLGLKYHDRIPIGQIDRILEVYGFNQMPMTSYYGSKEGRINEPVGHGKYITLTYYRMESGRIEIVAYIR